MPTEVRAHVRSPRRRAAGSRRSVAEPTVSKFDEPVEPSPRSVPTIVTVFRGPEGEIHHARCRRQIEFIGIRGGVEIDFYCLGCREHVTLTENTLPLIRTEDAMATATAGTTTGA